ncbi:MAG TPA: hypothetical protein VFU07_08085 [Candidatus Lumbricidophila sp.]|nr:hypothetical protein [Candidatus Lumbricidophila sp.]
MPFSALLAGACTGVLVGAACFGVMLAMGDPARGVRNFLSATLAGGTFLAAIGVGITWPLLTFTRQRLVEPIALGVSAAGSGLVLVLVAAVLSLINGATVGFGGALLLFLPAYGVCVAFALVLAVYFRRRRRQAVSVLVTTAGIALVGAAVLVTGGFAAP